MRPVGDKGPLQVTPKMNYGPRERHQGDSTTVHFFCAKCLGEWGSGSGLPGGQDGNHQCCRCGVWVPAKEFGYWVKCKAERPCRSVLHRQKDGKVRNRPPGIANGLAGEGSSKGLAYHFRLIQGRLVKEMTNRTNKLNIGKLELEEIGKMIRTCQQSLSAMAQRELVKSPTAGGGFRVIVPGVPMEKTGEKPMVSGEDETVQ